MTTAAEVITAAMVLKADERAEVAHELLLSLEPDDFDQDADQAWAAEIRKRLLAIREGQVSLRDWDDALADIQQSITKEGGQ